jgi:hypothetical protein
LRHLPRAICYGMMNDQQSLHEVSAPHKRLR